MGYKCATCGEEHDERPTAFLAPVPTVVHGIPEDQFADRVELSSDQVIVDDEHFYILGNLELPIVGSEEFLTFTVWVLVSEADFERASELWETEGRESEPPYASYLSNEIVAYEDTFNLQTQLHTGKLGVRPRISVVDSNHPLAADQSNGISESRASEIIHAAMHG